MKITRVEGDLTITKGNAEQYSGLEYVGGHLDVMADFSAPVLASIEGEKIHKPFRYKLKLAYPVLITDGYMRIGCQRHTHQEWRDFSGSQISTMASDATTFWKKHKKDLLAMCDEFSAVPA